MPIPIDIKELRNQRTIKLEDADKIMKQAAAAGRGLSEEERSAFDGLMKEAETLAGDIQRIEQLEERKRQAAGQKNITGNDLDMEQREVQRFSPLRLMRHLMDPSNESLRKAAEFEIEAARAAANVQGHSTRGLMIPLSAGIDPGTMLRLEREQDQRSAKLPGQVMARRNLSVGNAASAGDLVDTQMLVGSFIDMLTNRMALAGAGITMLPGLVGNISIPKQTAGSATYWLAENGEVTTSDISVANVPLSPKTLGCRSGFSRQLMMQSSIAVEQFLLGDMARAMALGIDLAGIIGTGADNQPRGVLNTAGIGVVPIGDNGGAITWEHLVDLETALTDVNADIGSLGYMTNGRVRGALKKAKKDAGSGQFLWDAAAGNTPVNGYGCTVSNQIPRDLTKGTGTDLSALLFGNWADLIMGLWGGLDIIVDPFSAAGQGSVRIVSFQSVDFGVRHAGSFAACKDIQPA